MISYFFQISKETESYIKNSGKLTISRPASRVSKEEDIIIIDDEDTSSDYSSPATPISSSIECDGSDIDNDVLLIKFTPGRKRNPIFRNESEKLNTSNESDKDKKKQKSRKITNIVSNDNSTTVNFISINCSNLININSETKNREESPNTNSSCFYDFFNDKGYNLRSESRSVVVQKDKKRRLSDDYVDFIE